jgi:hypothetical protein
MKIRKSSHAKTAARTLSSVFAPQLTFIYNGSNLKRLSTCTAMHQSRISSPSAYFSFRTVSTYGELLLLLQVQHRLAMHLDLIQPMLSSRFYYSDLRSVHMQ